MSDLISRSALFNRLATLNDKAEIFAAINDAPTVDAEPVKHGQWAIKHGVCTPGGDPLLYCPFCRSEESEHMGGIEMPRNWNYCPNCGTKMDLEAEN